MARYVIGDIHGCFDKLQQLLNALEIVGTDEIYLLGDLIDRGLQSRQVVDWARTSANVKAIQGNHELLMINSVLNPEDSDAALHWTTNGGIATLLSFDEDAQVTPELVEAAHWMAQLPYHMDLGDFFLVHAGLRPAVALEEQSSRDMVWIRKSFQYAPEPFFPDKTILVGHTITTKIEASRLVEPGEIVVGPGWINLDTGARLHGWLSALNLDSLEVVQVTPEDRVRRMPLMEISVSIS